MRRLFIWLLCLFPFLLTAQSPLTAGGLAAYIAPASGGGGGSGYTLISHIGQVGTTGNTTTGTIDTTGANLLIAVVSGNSLTHPTIIDSKSNSGWTADVDWFNNHISIFSCVPTTVGSGHTVTIQTSGGCNVIFIAVKKAGGTPSLDSISSGGTTFNWQSTTINSGSITPSTANNFFVSGTWWDVGTGIGDTVDSGYTIIDSPLGVSPGLEAAYFIASTSAAKNPGWTRGTPNNSDAFTIQASYK